MRHIYKTVSLEEYLRANKDLTIGAFTGAISGQLALALKASKAIESLINHYAKDGWEYVRSEEFHTGFFRSSSSQLFNAFKVGATGKSQGNPLLQMFIFKQEYTEELQRKMQADSDAEIAEAMNRPIREEYYGDE
jgi:hypothetical protein